MGKLRQGAHGDFSELLKRGETQIKGQKKYLGLSERELGNPVACKRFRVCPWDLETWSRSDVWVQTTLPSHAGYEKRHVSQSAKNVRVRSSHPW